MNDESILNRQRVSRNAKRRKKGWIAALLLCLLLLLSSCGEQPLPNAQKMAASAVMKEAADVSSELEAQFDEVEKQTEDKGLYFEEGKELTKEEQALKDELFEQTEAVWKKEEEKKSWNFESFWDVLQVPFGWLMDLCNRITFNYLLAMLLFTVLMKAILLPSSIKQQKNMVKQANFAPRQRAIQKKYAGRTDRVTQQQMQQELMTAQQEAGISAFGGCLSMFLQLPILYCVFTVIRTPLRFLSHLTSTQVGLLYMRARTLGFDPTGSKTEIDLVSFIQKHMTGDDTAFTPLLQGKQIPNFHVFGVDFGQQPSFNPEEPILWLLLLIPALTFLSYYFSMKLIRKFSYQPPVTEGQPDMQKSMKLMDLMMPLMSIWISFITPALLGVYWIYQSALGILQSYLLKLAYPYPQFTEEDYKEAERLYAGKKSKKGGNAAAAVVADPNRPKPRSLHHIDDDDDDELPEALRNAPVSSRYGDEDEPDPPKPALPKAPLKEGTKDGKKKSGKSQKKGNGGKSEEKKASDGEKAGTKPEAESEDVRENGEDPESKKDSRE